MNEREQMELNEQLINAAKEGNIEQIRKLIEDGADVNAINEFRQTPLHKAIELGRRETAELLLEKGADVNAADRCGETPLHVAIRYNRKELVELLLNGGANINAVERRRRTPLHVAVRCNCKELVELLLEKGANVNAVDNKGMTPLSIVASDCYQIVYCDKPMLVRTIIVYAVLHSGITTKPDCIVNNDELSKLWDDYQNEMMNIKLSNSTISLYQFLRETDENKLAGYLFDQNYDVRRYLEEKQYERDFPIYANIITGQLHKAMKRKDLLYRSDIVMNHSVDLKDFLQEIKSKITNYLTNEELRNVIRAPFSILSEFG
ncbi:MAG: ankyrin repeat domain-containing protein [Wolbachia sp.]